MKRIIPVAALILASTLAPAARAADPVVGSDRAVVTAELGDPTARMTAGPREVLMYPRGKIVLENGIVTQVALKSREEFAKDEERRIAEEKARREEAARRREAAAREAAAFAERRKLANAELAKLVEDPAWIKHTGDERLELLTRFQRKHPEAETEFELKLARQKRDREYAEKDRINDLEARLAAAERRAEAAEAKAAEAARSAERAEDRAREVRYVETPVYIPTTAIVTDACRVPAHRPVNTIRMGGLTVTTGANDNCVHTQPAMPVRPIYPVTPAKPTTAKDKRTDGAR